MIKSGNGLLRSLQRHLTLVYGTDISTPRARRAAWWHFQLIDHACLRVWWKNLDRVAPGLWRSNQPAPADLERLARQGLRTVINLRGRAERSFWLFEAETCERLGITLLNLRLSALQPPSRETLLALIEVMDNLERPALIHCKSGADRTGLAAAIWQMTQMEMSADQAMAQLSWRYVHFRSSAAGMVDQILRSYAAQTAQTGSSFRDWVSRSYEPDQIRSDFALWRGRG